MFRYANFDAYMGRTDREKKGVQLEPSDVNSQGWQEDSSVCFFDRIEKTSARIENNFPLHRIFYQLRVLNID
jgi:hypothetical protein